MSAAGTAWSVAAVVGLAVALAVWPTAWPWRLLSPGDDHGAGGVARPTARRAGRRRATGRAARRGRGELDAGPLGCLELLAVALSSGAGLHRSIVEVAASGPLGRPLAGTAVALDRGQALADALDELPRREGPAWRPVAVALAVTATSGAPALPALRRLVAAERTRRRRETEARLRRLPVLLLLPLATLALPAFALVTFVPVLVALGDGVT